MNKTLSNSARIIGTGIAAAFLALAPLLASLAHGQERHERRGHEHERYQTPHWVYDDRFHHNHYYPSVGYSVTALPAGNIAVTFRSGRFFFHSGVWFQPAGPGFVVVRPPVGIVVPVLPPAYTTVWAAGVPYYYANDVYYIEKPGGYGVTAPPMEATAAPAQTLPPPSPGPAAPAPTAPTAPQSGYWYYCAESRVYYPYVNQCPGGWQRVSPQPPSG